MPAEESGTFEGQFTLVVTDGDFDLPAARISEDNLPGELRRMGRFIGQQVPRGLAFASGND